MWSIADIADAVHAGLAAEAARLDEEQAVRGLDSADELGLHPVVARGLEEAGYGVHREERYPADRHKRSESEGERCDFVLTPQDLPLAAPGREPTLFDPPRLVPLDEAFWLEVKLIAQFTSAGPNRNYASQLLRAASQDVAKLNADPGILHAGLLIVLFAEDDRVADHDLGTWLGRCLDRGLPLGSPALRRVAVTDRIGNRRCAVALHPVGRR